MTNYLITGAGGGMGSALCRALAEAGDRVWGIDLHAPESGAEGWSFLQADLRDTETLEQAREQISAECPEGLDGIVHAAGLYDLDSLVEMPEENFLRIFDVNVFGTFRINRLFVPLLRGKGRVVIITSELASLHPLPFTGIYGVTKTAADQYAAALRMELQLLGHRVIVIRPGAVRTGMLPASTAKLDRFCEETKLYRCNADRFRRIVGKVEARNVPPEAIAALIQRALKSRRPRLVYTKNRNPLLLLLNGLPKRFQLWVIRRILA